MTRAAHERRFNRVTSQKKKHIRMKKKRERRHHTKRSKKNDMIERLEPTFKKVNGSDLLISHYSYQPNGTSPKDGQDGKWKNNTSKLMCKELPLVDVRGGGGGNKKLKISKARAHGTKGIGKKEFSGHCCGK